jgi:hypothetical protein
MFTTARRRECAITDLQLARASSGASAQDDEAI